MNRKVINTILVIFIIIFIISGGLLIKDLLRSKKEIKTNIKLAQIVSISKKEIDNIKKVNEDKSSIYAESGILYQYDKLWQKNNDMIGWIHIDGTNIDYPILYRENDSKYYLRKGFDKKYAYSGSIFITEKYSEDKNYTVIYGHNMKDGSMFSSLEKYKSKEFVKEHPIIQFDTITQEREYEIIGAFYSKIDEEENTFKYYNYNDLSNINVFNEFISNVKNNSIYDTGVEAIYGDKIIALSTCSYHTKNGRFAVIAKEKRK